MLTILRPVLENFVEALYYTTRKLRQKCQHYDQYVASNVPKFVKRIHLQLKETGFHESDLISIFADLEKFRDACDSIGAHEKVDHYVSISQFHDETNIVVSNSPSIIKKRRYRPVNKMRGCYPISESSISCTLYMLLMILSPVQ